MNTRSFQHGRRTLLAGIAGAWVARQAGAAAPVSGSQLELDEAARRGELCSAVNAVGVGLKGEYFSGPNQTGRVLLSRIDPVVDFPTSVDWPADQKGPRPRSVRWSGWIKPPVGGAYRFHMEVPGSKLTVGQTVLDGANAPPDAKVELAAGRFTPVTIDVPDLAAVKNGIRLEWTAPYGARFIIPRPLLHLPSDTVATPTRS